MTNITQEVRDFLHKTPFIVKALNYGIVNNRALAAYISNELNLGYSIHAIMSAIRRYEKQPKISRKEIVQEIYRNSKISTKSRLLMITVQRHFDVLKKIIPDILAHIHVSKGEVLRMVEGRQSIKFIIDHSKKDEILSLIPKKELLGTNENLGEINIHLDESHGDIPGLISPILNELALNDINIIQSIGGYPEIVIIIREDQISTSHDIILRFLYAKASI